MSLSRSSVVHFDPTNERDVLSASPAKGKQDGTIAVTHNAQFGVEYDNHGRTQSVCIPAGHEKTVLGKLGDKLLGIGAEDDDVTIVTTFAELSALIKKLTESAPLFSQQDVASALAELSTTLTSSTHTSSHCQLAPWEHDILCVRE